MGTEQEAKQRNEEYLKQAEQAFNTALYGYIKFHDAIGHEREIYLKKGGVMDNKLSQHEFSVPKDYGFDLYGKKFTYVKE